MLFKYLFHAMTAPCELQIYHDKKNIADAVAASVLKEVKRLEKKYNFYSGDSELAKINNRNTSKISLDDETKTILQKTLRYSEKVNFVFDISVGTLKECYGKKKIKDVEKCLDSLYPFVGRDSFFLENSTLTFSSHHTKLDLGGVVKEYSIDRSLMILRENKIKSALINYGGDIFALGTKPDKSKWRVGVKNPKFPEKNILGIELEDKALATSAHYERRITVEKNSYSHILLPGKQTASRILQATAISSSALKSGIYSTSLLIDENIMRQVAATKRSYRSGKKAENSSPKEKLLRCNSITDDFEYILIDDSLRITSNYN